MQLRGLGPQHADAYASKFPFDTLLGLINEQVAATYRAPAQLLASIDGSPRIARRMSSTPFIESRRDADFPHQDEDVSHTSAEESRSQSQSQRIEEYETAPVSPLHRQEDSEEEDRRSRQENDDVLEAESATEHATRDTERSLVDGYATVPDQLDTQALREEAAPTTAPAPRDAPPPLPSAASTSSPPSLRQPRDLERSPSTESEGEKERSRAQRRHTISARIASERKKLQLSARKRVSLGTPGSADLRRRLDLLKAASSSQAGSPAMQRQAAGSTGRRQTQIAQGSQGGGEDDSMIDVQNMLVPHRTVSVEPAPGAGGSPMPSFAGRESVPGSGYLARAMEPDSESEQEQEEDDEAEQQRVESQLDSEQEAETQTEYIARLLEPDSSDDETEDVRGRPNMNGSREPEPDENEEAHLGLDYRLTNNGTGSPGEPTPPPKDEGDDDDGNVSRPPVFDTPAALIEDFDNFLALTMARRGGPSGRQDASRDERPAGDQAEPGYIPPDELEPGQGYEMDNFAGGGGDDSDAGGDDMQGGFDLVEGQDEVDESDENDDAQNDEQPAGRIQFDSQNRLRRTVGAKPKGAFHGYVHP